jgi:dTDP-4-dehydrorhamnose reductase
MTKPESQPANPVPPKTVLILGASGMLGHMLVRVLSPRHRVIGTTSSQYKAESPLAKLLDRESWIGGIDVRSLNQVDDLVREIQPDVVINCVGVIKQKMESSNITDAITINSLFPHHLANLCQSQNSRLIHFSTDCVFEGTPGMKMVSDTPNATDLYGTTKRLGEVDYGDSITIRSSIVGAQIVGTESLFQWAISQKGKKIEGFTGALYSGLTTMTMSKVILEIVDNFPQLSGIQQIASEAITKHDLLRKLNAALGLNLDICPDNTIIYDRTLDGSEFVEQTGIRIPTWDEMIIEFAGDQAFYSND